MDTVYGTQLILWNYFVDIRDFSCLAFKQSHPQQALAFVQIIQIYNIILWSLSQFETSPQYKVPYSRTRDGV